jgi:hypothetical protein
MSVGFGVDGTVSDWTFSVASTELSVVIYTVIKICKAQCFNLHFFMLTSSSLCCTMDCVLINNAAGCIHFKIHSGKKLISRKYTSVKRS